MQSIKPAFPSLPLPTLRSTGYAFVAAIGCFLSTNASATLIDFESELSGYKSNGYSVGGVEFFSTSGSDLYVGDFGAQGDGISIGSVSDSSQSAIRLKFSSVYDQLSFGFGNDDPRAGYKWGLEANAMLRLFCNQEQVAEMRLVPNGDDIMNETFFSSGIQYDEALFWYMLPSSSTRGVTVGEVIDNINFTRSVPLSVPEPESLALFSLGLLGLVVTRQRRRAPGSHTSI